MPYKMKNCRNPDCNNEFRQSSTLQKYCSFSCLKAHGKSTPPKKTKKQINPIGKKQLVRNLQYSADRKVFLGKPENKICFIEGCNKPANTVEHTKGRKGYADEWARENKVWLLNDVRFWKPCCAEHNSELENNPELSHKYQLSKLHNGKKGDLK